MSINIERKSESSDGYNVTCKRCSRKFLKWIHSDYTRSGWELQEKDGRTHNCYSNPKVSEKDKQLAHFIDEIIIYEDDDPETVKKKMELQDKLKLNPIEKLEILEANMKRYGQFYKKQTFFG